MNIYAVGRNYAAHIEELKNERPEEPIIFTKPDTALLKNNQPFYYPDFTKDVHHEVELVLRVGKNGKNIQEKFAHKYYDQIGVGIDFTARDVQAVAKAKGLPWAIAKGFDGSAPVSKFVEKDSFGNLNSVDFSLTVDGEIKQKGNTSLMLFSFDYIIFYISQFFTLRQGDLIFTGTPEGVGPVQIGNIVAAYIGKEKFLDFEIK